MIFLSKLDLCIVEVICLLIISKYVTNPLKFPLNLIVPVYIVAIHLWYNFTHVSTCMSKVRVAYTFNSISYDMICNNVDTFDAIIRKSIHSFRKRILSTNNVIIQSIYISSYLSKSSIM